MPLAPVRLDQLARAIALAIVASSVSAGCLGGPGASDDDRLAQPTEEVALPPNATLTPTTPTANPQSDPAFGYEARNTKDAGVQLLRDWQVGDVWSYESNDSRTLRIFVVATRQVDDQVQLLVELQTGHLGSPKEGITQLWVGQQNRTIVSGSDVNKFSYEYRGRAPMTAWSNTSFDYNLTTRDPSGRVLDTVRFTTNTWLDDNLTVVLPWGNQKVGFVKHFVNAEAGGANERYLERYYVRGDFGNALLRQVGDGPLYRLTGVDYGDIHEGFVPAR